MPLAGGAIAARPHRPPPELWQISLVSPGVQRLSADLSVMATNNAGQTWRLTPSSHGLFVNGDQVSTITRFAPTMWSGP